MQHFEKNKGQSLGFSKCARDKNTLAWQGTWAKFCEKQGRGMLGETFCNKLSIFLKK